VWAEGLRERDPVSKVKTNRSAIWGRRAITTVALSAFLILGQGSAWAKGKKANDLKSGNGSDVVDVIVQYNQDVDKGETNAKGHGAHIHHKFNAIKALAMQIRADQLDSLINEDSNIKYVSPNRDVAGEGVADYYGAINADLTRSSGYDGTYVGVAVIDSGITRVGDLNSANSNGNRIVYAQDFTGSGTTDDQYGHGTHVAGLLGGNGRASQCLLCFVTYYGVADDVNFINLKVLDKNGVGKDSNIIAAIQTAINKKSLYNIRIINLSLGRPVYESYKTDPLTQAVEAAWKAGIFVVVSAGNYGRDNSFGENGYGTITSPGNDPYVITVGAMNTKGTRSIMDDVPATYSSKGPTAIDHIVKPDLVAPGNQINSVLSPSSTLSALSSTKVALTEYQSVLSLLFSSSYLKLSGTSMAAPLVSGTAALMFDKNPNLTPDQVKAILMKTANKNLVKYATVYDASTGITYNEQADMFTVGAGYLDANAALKSSDLAPSNVGVAKSPSAALNVSTHTAYLVKDASVIWGNSVIWGSTVVWGNSVIWGSDGTVDANSVIWGGDASTVDATSVIWGSSVIWGNADADACTVIWGNSVIWGNVDADAMTTSAAQGVLTRGE
jgi:serine protease AprX